MVRLLCASVLFFISFMSFGEEFVVGKDYEIVNKAENIPAATDKINVTEFFSFGCPWCYKVDPAVNQWVSKKEDNIQFKKVPVIFNKDWVYYAKAYYAIQALSLSPTLQPALFKAIAQDKRPLNSDNAMIDFFIQQGVNPEIAKSAFGYSPSIELSIKESEGLMASYQVRAVPAFVVNNQYKTDLQMAKTEERLFAILDFLLTQAKEKKA